MPHLTLSMVVPWLARSKTTRKRYDKVTSWVHFLDPKANCSNLSRNVTPGGWVEFQDWDLQLYSEDGSTRRTNLENYCDTVVAAFARAGYQTCPGPHLERWLREAGFNDVHSQRYKVPLGVWPKNKYFVRYFTFKSPSAACFLSGAYANAKH